MTNAIPMGSASVVTHFVEHLVKTALDPLPALAQARAALALLCGTVLGRDLGELPQPRPPCLLDQLRLAPGASLSRARP
jgi:hypothetical protein